MRFRARKEDDVRVEVTPLIDIVFQLVLFFMVSTTFDDSPQLDIQLPDTANQTILQDHKNIELWVDKNGAYWIQQTPYSPEQLPVYLKEAFLSNPDMALIVQADETVSHGTVVDLLNIAQSAGIVNMSIGGKKEAAP